MNGALAKEHLWHLLVVLFPRLPELCNRRYLIEDCSGHGMQTINEAKGASSQSPDFWKLVSEWKRSH